MPEEPARQHDELFEIVDENDVIRGVAPRSACHGNPHLIHRTAHVVVFHSTGKLLLQKRSSQKDIQPGKWDTAVGGHLAVGESYEQAARREMTEEIGIDPDTPMTHILDAKIRNDIESENVRVFKVTHDGPFRPQPGEIDALKFWTATEIADAMGTGCFTPNLEREIHELRQRKHLPMEPT